MVEFIMPSKQVLKLPIKQLWNLSKEQSLQYHISAASAAIKLNLQMMLLVWCISVEPRLPLAKTPEIFRFWKKVGEVDSGGQVWSSFVKVSCQPSQVSISQRTSKRHLLRWQEWLMQNTVSPVAGHVAAEDITLVTVRNHDWSQTDSNMWKTLTMKSSKILE